MRASKRPCLAGSMNRKRERATYATWYQLGRNATPARFRRQETTANSSRRLAREPEPGVALAGEGRAQLGEVRARVLEAEPVDEQELAAADLPGREHRIDEQVALAVRLAGELHPLAGVGLVERDPEPVVANPPELIEEPVPLERVLHALRRVEVEQPLLGPGAAEQLVHLALGEQPLVVRLVGEQRAGDLAGDLREPPGHRVVAPGNLLPSAPGEHEPGAREHAPGLAAVAASGEPDARDPAELLLDEQVALAGAAEGEREHPEAIALEDVAARRARTRARPWAASSAARGAPRGTSDRRRRPGGASPRRRRASPSPSRRSTPARRPCRRRSSRRCRRAGARRGRGSRPCR